MNDTTLAAAVCLVFVALAAWHVVLMMRPMSRASAAVPSVDGQPLFVPSRWSTLAVAIALLLFAVLVAATSGIISVGLSRMALSWLSFGLALGLIARAIGEFKYVGLFKRVRGTRFATFDTWVYSPLCLLLAAGVWHVARSV